MEINFDLLPEAIISLAANVNGSYIIRQLRAFASLRLPILIVGQEGIGKESLARAMHEWSGRPGELIVRDCANVNLGEVLFGADKGSTLVLKNVTFLSRAGCSELLTWLMTDSSSRVRIVATSSIPLELDDSRSETLPRELLTYLCSIQLTFSDPSNDLLFLASRFFEAANRRYNKCVKIEEDALPHFRRLNYDEDVKSLQQLIERTVAAATTDLLITTVEMEMAAARGSLPESLADPWANLSLERETILFERRLVRLALKRTNGSIRKAARLLGISRQTLSNKIRSRHPGIEAFNVV